MSLNIEVLANRMEALFNDIVIEEKVKTLSSLKEELHNKQKIINNYIKTFQKMNRGKNTKKFIQELRRVEENYKQLYANFDDKLMIFIIGNGNVGKSTLLNALIGYEVAETNFLPNTWKIDVYSPEINKDEAIIKFINGKQITLPIQQVKQVVKEDENKSKESKKTYNNQLNVKLKELKTKEERSEMKQYLADRYLYKSKISEVRWPVERNWLLEKCLLVDTPGLNQNLHDQVQIGNIHDYYHKADGVLWLLDGQTIAAANANSLFEELDDVLQNVGGVRDNIVGVINRMDLVKKNGGSEAVHNVLDDARRIFGDKFFNIVDLSARQALEGIKDNNSLEIKDSGILKLQNAIRDIFISKSESIKNSAKTQGNSMLLDKVKEIIEDYKNEISDYEEMYHVKQSKLHQFKEALQDELYDSISNFFMNYCIEVDSRVDLHISELSKGKDEQFVIKEMYDLDNFSTELNALLNMKQKEMNNEFYMWRKISRISEYKYIEVNKVDYSEPISINIEIDYEALKNLNYFTPSQEESVSAFLGNMVGKGFFLLNKGSMKKKIKEEFSFTCDLLLEDITQKFDLPINATFEECNNVLNDTFSDILFNIEDIDIILKRLKKFNAKIFQESESIQLKDILL